MRKTLTLTGNNNIDALPTGDARVNRMRWLQAWLRCEYMLETTCSATL